MDSTQQGEALAAGATGDLLVSGGLSEAAVPVAAGTSAQLAVTEPPGDAGLMLRYRDGDVAAFEQLYQRHKDALYRYLMRMCHDREVANDLFQEVWGKVIASRERYEPRAQFNTFLFHIAHNCAVDHFRRADRQRADRMQDVTELEETLVGADSERPDARLTQMQMRDALLAALRQLPVEQRNVFVLYEESGLSLEEIGKLTGVAMETAKSRLRYAVNKLRSALHPHQAGPLERGVKP